MIEEKKLMNRIDIINTDIEYWEKEIRFRESWIKGSKENINELKQELKTFATESEEEKDE